MRHARHYRLVLDPKGRADVKVNFRLLSKANLKIVWFAKMRVFSFSICSRLLRTVCSGKRHIFLETGILPLSKKCHTHVDVVKRNALDLPSNAGKFAKFAKLVQKSQ